MTSAEPRLLTDPWRIFRRRDLLREGFTDEQIASAWRDGRVIRVRHGVYAAPDAIPEVVRAVRVGGVLAGPSAAAVHGIWVVPNSALTVSVMPNAQRLRDPDHPGVALDTTTSDVVLVRDRHHLDPIRERAVVSAATVVIQAIRHLEPRFALAVMDSALRLPPTTRPSLDVIGARLPFSRRSLLALVDGAAESGTESVFRHGVIRAGVPFESQKWLTDSIRVDFVLAGFLVVECVSKEHHGSYEKYGSDRARISAIVTLGYVVLEFTYAQIMFEWDSVWASVLTSLRLVGAALPSPSILLQS